MTPHKEAILERPRSTRVGPGHVDASTRRPTALAVLESVASTFVAKMIQGQVTALQRYEPTHRLLVTPELQELDERHYAELVPDPSELALPGLSSSASDPALG